ncbi:hypothetical protein PENTCL1PPCAC_3464, partial [Pristionchus entomophagus]
VTHGTVTTSPGTMPNRTPWGIVPRRRKRRERTTWSYEQKVALETAFEQAPYQDVYERQELAEKINTYPSRVMIWFKNRRVRQRMIE